MKYMQLLTIVAMGTLAACKSGDINLTPSTVDNSVDNSSTTTPSTTESNPCASYSDGSTTVRGDYDGTNCLYDSLFVSDTRPIVASSVTFENFGGFHIFEDSLYIGEDVDASAAASGKRIPQEGEGTRLTIEAGNTMVFNQADSYVRIARGSQIFAEGSAEAPITFTADEDAIQAISTESDRGLWGGIQINGNGRTNKCHDGSVTGSGSGTVSDYEATGSNVHNCHVTAEGRPATYGGNNNAENSGVLGYVVIKHAGFEVVDGDELNALTLNAVGSGTTISYVQTYTAQDDGFELFGGAVNLDHIVAVNVGDDSIDFSEGYNGDIQYAVVMHTSGGNRCIEGDNTGGGRADDITPTSKLRISNMTCITSNVDENSGMNPSSKGDSEGVLFREGAFFEIYNSLITSNEAAMSSNECFELDDSEGPQTVDGAQSGISIAQSNLLACSEPLKIGTLDAANGVEGVVDAFELQAWLNGGGAVAQIPVNTNTSNVVESINIPAMSLIVGGVGTRGYLTAASLTDSAGAVLFDQITQLTDVSALGGIFIAPSYLGGANEGDDWLAGWTVGMSDALNP